MRLAVTQFIAEHRALLARGGSLQATWRKRAGKRNGPYYLLIVRDAERRIHSVYLGPAGPVVDEVRAELARLQAPGRERRACRRSQRALRRELQNSKQALDRSLAPAGLWRKGCEVRGWRGGRRR